MASKAEIRPLAELARITSGKRPPSAAKVAAPGTAVPIVGGGGVSGYTEQPLFVEPVLVTGRVGTLGKLFAIDGPIWPSDNALVVIANAAEIHPEFLRYALQAVIHEAIGMNRGAANPLVTQKDLGQLPISVIPPDEQKDVASLLRALDDGIDVLRQSSATLEAIAQALFKSWFVDFDPVRARAEGREPEGMDPATAALFPREFEESELGLIPKGWRAHQFGSLLSASIGGDWGSETPTPEQTERVAIIRGTDIPDLRSHSTCRVPVRFTTARKLASRVLAPGDLIVEVSGGSKDQSTGRSIYVTAQLLSLFDCPVVPASFCRRFSPANERVGLLLAQHMDYIYAVGKTWDYQNQSTGIANFQTTHFLATERVVVPSDPVLDAFVDMIMPIAERVQLRKAAILADIRDTLLPRLISGKLRLPEAESLVERTVA